MRVLLGRRARPALAAAMLIAAVVPFLAPGGALAASPVDGAVLLEFGQAYGTGSVHRGLDLAAEAGTVVRAAAAGTISFVGAVPADGGGTVVAVTLQMADGTKVTVLPLERALAGRGSPVEAGDSVGVLAGSGDGSSGESHVHLSMRRGSVYLDPTPLLSLPAGADSNRPGTQAGGAPGGSAVGAPGTAGAAGRRSAGATTRPPQSASNAQIAAQSEGLGSGVTLAPERGAAPAPAPPVPSAIPVTRQTGVLALGPATQPAATAPDVMAPPPVVVRGLDVSALLRRAEVSARGYAGRHVRALAIGVGALLAGFAALMPLGRRAGSGGVVCAVRPEGDAVAAPAGR